MVRGRCAGGRGERIKQSRFACAETVYVCVREKGVIKEKGGEFTCSDITIVSHPPHTKRNSMNIGTAGKTVWRLRVFGRVADL